MRRIAVVLALLPAVARAGAGTLLDDGAAAVEIAGPVEVPLLIADRNVPAVVVTIPGSGEDPEDQRLIAVIDLGSAWSHVSEGTAGALGLKIRKGKNDAGHELKWVVVPEVRIGAVVLHDLAALIWEGDAMQIGCSTLPELATAILPSRGVVKFVPAASGAALLSEVGEPVTTEAVAPKPFHEHGSKRSSQRHSIAVPGEIAGHKGLIRIHTGRSDTIADPFDASPAVVTESVIDAPIVNGVTLARTRVLRSELQDPNDALVGDAGWDSLHVLDIAVAPASRQIALKLATDHQSKPAALEALEIAKADYAAAKPEDDAVEPETDAKIGIGDPGKAPTVSKELALAPAFSEALAMVPGAREEALAHYKAAADAAGDSCRAHHEYGFALIELGGDPAAAIPELTRAATAWDQWYAQPKAARDTIAAGKNKDPDAYAVKQATSCFTAWGDLAEAYLALGDHAQVKAIYTAHTDLDPDLPLAYGLSLLAQGEMAAAEGPIRQALSLGERSDGTVRAALAMTGATAAWTEDGLDRLVTSHATESLVNLSPVIEAARSIGGNGEARRVASALVARDPLNPVPALLLAREVSDAERPAQLETARALIAAHETWQGATVQAAAWSALAQAIGGDAPAARAALAKYPGFPEAEMAAAIVDRDDGDPDAARLHREVLAKHQPLTAAVAIASTRLDLRLPGLPGSPVPPREAPAALYTTGCADIPASEYDTPIAGTWTPTGDTRDRIAFQADRWCVFDDTGLRAKGGAASWSIYACPGVSPAPDQPVQETYLVLHDAEHSVTTCTRFVQIGDKAGLYGQACPGEAPYSTYGASARIGQWTRTAEAAPPSCWEDPAPPPPPGKKAR